MSLKRTAGTPLVALASLALAAGCSGKDGSVGPAGEPGPKGADGAPGPQGPKGADGVNGTNGASGVDGTNGVDGVDGVDGENGADGTNGLDGLNGTAGVNGQACWDLDGNGSRDLATEDFNADGVVNAWDCRGFDADYVPIAPAGVVGFVTDTADEAVVGATVVLVPTADISNATIALRDIAVERVSTVDEPLEDAIALNGATYVKAVTDPNGLYRIATVPAGTYFLVVVPGAGGHLPGGSRCRTALSSSELIGEQVDIEVSTSPSAEAEYVGPSVCLNCHGFTHVSQTAHMLGIRQLGKSGPLQDSRRFPDWERPLAKFTALGTTLYYSYNGNASAPDWRVSETNPGAGVSFTATLYSDVGRYFVELRDVKGATLPATYELDISYGGGLYKQRFLTNIGGSRYVLPIQFNFEGQTDETQPPSRWVWIQYNAQYWYDEAVPGLRTPSKSKSFDNNCAGCHFTGYSLTGDATVGYRAHAVPDEKGDMDYDGDGLAEAMNISCESCHGPGSEHWEKAGRGHAIVTPGLLTPEREVAICTQCHSRALGIGGGATEAYLDSSGNTFRAGLSRRELLTSYISRLDDGLWDTNKGDGLHSKKHHQQASDFIKTSMYRNSTNLMTCASCHDPHGNTGLDHQIREPLDNTNAAAGPGLCMSCHETTIPAGATFSDRVQAHYASKAIINVGMLDIKCIDCHMPKTAKSGSGRKQLTIAGTSYYSGDISSHLFDVPRRTSITTKAADMMPIAYSNSCGLCHVAAP
ncbi:MAG: NapC/NirT family cytochrome c [Deltaproteobacteria bacterium]|nr:NapC/NirT family cytochrome c [Deltaproteobacteria bacterium]